jgi:hypothetical protein
MPDPVDKLRPRPSDARPHGAAPPSWTAHLDRMAGLAEREQHHVRYLIVNGNPTPLTATETIVFRAAATMIVDHPEIVADLIAEIGRPMEHRIIRCAGKSLRHALLKGLPSDPPAIAEWRRRRLEEIGIVAAPAERCEPATSNTSDEGDGTR